jgi:2-hydroxycyclohexanecarboxyl-CoA dehydrogenase
MTSRVAVVTGGAQGIGRGIVESLVADGHRVAIADLNLDVATQAAQEIGEGAIAVRMDVTDTASVTAAIAEIEDRLGPVEVVVNNAGWDDFMPFLKTTEEFWDKILEINFKGHLRVIQATVPGMVERGFGRVINIGSDAGRVGSSLEAVYSGAKGGIIAFTKTLAREVAGKGVTANTVCPGPTDTPALRSFTQSSGQDAARGPDEATRQPDRHRPRRRLLRLRRVRLRDRPDAVRQRRPHDGLTGDHTAYGGNCHVRQRN